MLKDRLKSWFFSRGRLQIFSVLVAIVAWFVVHSGQTVQQRVSFKIVYQNLASNMIFKKDPPSELRVLLTGSFYRVRGMSPEEKVYPVDLSASRGGMNSIDVDLGNLKLPIDLIASNPVPRRLDFQLEELHRKEVPVKVAFQGSPAQGYVVTSVQATPDPIQLIGPSTSLESVSEVSVPVSLEGKSESFSTSVPLNLEWPQTKAVDTVYVEVGISYLNRELSLKAVPVLPSASEKKIKLTPSAADLVLRGTEEKLSLAEQDLKVVVPVEGLSRGRYRVRAQVKLEEGVQLVSLQPESFIVEVME